MSDPILPLSEQLQRQGSLSRQLVWLLRHRLLAVCDLLQERGLINQAVVNGARSFPGDIDLLPETRLAEERRVFAAFAARPVRLLALKGCLVGHLVYPHPRARPRGDLDVLVSLKEREPAREVLRGLGYKRRMAVDEHEPAIQEQWQRRHESDDVDLIDLHWDLRKQALFHGLFPFEQLWERSVALPSLGAEARGLDPLHGLINAALHWFELQIDYMPQGWLLDIDLLWRRLGDAGQQELMEVVIENQVAGLIGHCLANAHIVFNTPLDEAVIEHLKEAGRHEKATRLIKAGRTPLGYHWFEFRTTPGLTGKARWVGSIMFPPPENMRVRYPQGSRLGLPGLYARRIIGRFLRLRNW